VPPSSRTDALMPPPPQSIASVITMPVSLPVRGSSRDSIDPP
jgi:hypothetical protein